MANWKERIEEAFRGRDEVEKRYRAGQRSRGVEASKVNKELKKPTEYKMKQIAAENNLLRSGAYELLEKVRKDVWKTGSIRKLDLGGATLLLETSYNDTIITGPRTVGGSDGGVDYSEAGEYRIRKFYDRLVIHSGLGQSEFLIVYEGNHIKESFPFGSRNLYDSNATEIRSGKEELEEVVLSICLRRIKDRSLPPIPWYKR